MVNSTANEPTGQQTGNAKDLGTTHCWSDSIASVKQVSTIPLTRRGQQWLHLHCSAP